MGFLVIIPKAGRRSETISSLCVGPSTFIPIKKNAKKSVAHRRQSHFKLMDLMNPSKQQRPTMSLGDSIPSKANKTA